MQCSYSNRHKNIAHNGYVAHYQMSPPAATPHDEIQRELHHIDIYRDTPIRYLGEIQ